MEVSHGKNILGSPAMKRLGQFVCQQEQKWQTGGNAPEFEDFERELHEHIMAVERELIAEEMSRYDVEGKAIKVEGKVYQPGIRSPETYYSAAGPVKVERQMYQPVADGKSICPLELRVGIVGGLFTPRAARQATYAMAHLTSREAAGLFEELGNMQPSRSTLDRLPKKVSVHWDAKRKRWESALRKQESVPVEATILGVSLDGVMAPMRDTGRKQKRSQSDKEPKGPAGYREVGCGTVSMYDAEGQRLDTIRYGRMPERKKLTLCQQLEAEVQSILAVNPDLKLVKLADGAKDNWRFLSHLDLGLPRTLAACTEQVEIVDFFHAVEQLKTACDAIWQNDKIKCKAEFVRLRTLLKEQQNGVEKIIRTLKYYAKCAKKKRKECILKQLTYFRNNRHRMQYADYLDRNLPIGSGVVEAACKTLVTQRYEAIRDGLGFFWWTSNLVFS